MEDVLTRYRRLADAFAATVAGVPDDGWDAPSPCPDWTARDVVRHVSQTPGLFFGFIDAEYGDLPDEPVAAFGAARQRMEAALGDPATADKEFDGFFGRSTFANAVDRFINFDLVVHRWDLAKAAGLDTTIADQDVARLEEAAKHFGDAMRGPGAFGPALDPPAGADRQTKLLCFLGRRP
jgi:uncharacterized protein (TIGR03086 family)